MIIKMKKATVLMYSRLKKDNLKALKKAGVLHVQQLEGKGEEFLELVKQSQEVNTVCDSIFGDLSAEKMGIKPVKCSIDSTIELCKRINRLTGEISDVQMKADDISLKIEKQSFWGDFSSNSIELIHEKGTRIRLFTISKKNLPKIELKQLYTISEDKMSYGLALIERDEEKQEISPLLVEHDFPEKSLSELGDELQIFTNQIQELSKEKETLQEDKGAILFTKSALDEQLIFTTIESGSETGDEQISIFQGYVPEPEMKNLANVCRNEGMGLVLEDPSELDDVPVQVKSSKFSSLIKPLFSFLDTIPGYNEFDISPIFLIYFSIFFAIIIGDAGYGVILSVLSLFMIIKNRKKKSVKAMFSLLLLLGSCTVIWGTISGNWFGYEGFIANLETGETRLLGHLVIPQINSFADISIKYMIWFSFILGLSQLALAHLMCFFREIFQTPRIKAFRHIGWIVLSYLMYDLATFLIVFQQKDYKLNPLFMYLLPFALLTIFIFANQEGKFFKGILTSLGDSIGIFLNYIGMFSDLTSYIRLFAVGMASAKVAEAFNMLAGMLGDEIYMKVFAVVILFLGHTLNLGLGLMSVIVHGVRLNILEFSGHLDMEWSGYKYEPFREIENK